MCPDILVHKCFHWDNRNTCTWIKSVSRLAYSSEDSVQCKWTSFNPLRAWTEQRCRGRLNASSVCLTVSAGTSVLCSQHSWSSSSRPRLEPAPELPGSQAFKLPHWLSFYKYSLSAEPWLIRKYFLISIVIFSLMCECSWQVL